MTEIQPSPQRAPAGWAGMAAVAATYVYFLLFAEFALIDLFERPGSESASFQTVMPILGLSGVGGSVLAGATFRLARFRLTLASAYVAAGLGALLVLVPGSLVVRLAAVAVVGVSLGMLTVTLAAGLRACIDSRHLGLVIGSGTGLAYAFCNIPPVFQASPYGQTLVASAVVLVASLLPIVLRPAVRPPTALSAARPAGMTRWVALFFVLVWLDSAAFYIIQHTELLRQGTWAGSGQLWLNAGIHLFGAIIAGRLLDLGTLRGTMAAGLLLLVAACAVLASSPTGTRGAAVLYTAGVSSYSVGLVFVAAQRGRAWDAAAFFALAGWVGSALGIGMAQDLSRIPLTFVAGAALLGGLLLARRWPHRTMTGLAASWVALAHGSSAEAAKPGEKALLGREVYIAEGCIHCHSQFHRPGTVDVERWGPAPSLADALHASPPLFGNRRQGPDLSRVGQRQTPEWNRLHLIAPRSLVPKSRMPSYAHLFVGGGESGEALLAYLATLGSEPVPGDGGSLPVPPRSSPAGSLAPPLMLDHADSRP